MGVFVDFTLTTTHFFFEEITRTRMVRDFLPLMVPQLLLILTYLLPLTEYFATRAGSVTQLDGHGLVLGADAWARTGMVSLRTCRTPSP